LDGKWATCCSWTRQAAEREVVENGYFVNEGGEGGEFLETELTDYGCGYVCGDKRRGGEGRRVREGTVSG